MRTRHLAAILLVAVIAGFAFWATPQTSQAKTPIAPKTGTEGKALMFAHLTKQFVIDRDTPKGTIESLGQIENAQFIFDGKGNFPPKSKLVALANTGKPVTLLLPLDYTKAHLRRFAVLSDYSIRFRISPKAFDLEAARRTNLFGPRHLEIEATPADLTEETLKNLGALKRFSLRLVVPAGEVLDAKQLALLRRKVLAAANKEIVLPEDYPPKAIKSLMKFKDLRITVRVRGKGPDVKLAEALNRYSKVNTGAELRGLIKPNEAPNYLVLKHLNVLIMHVESWAVTPEFIRLMNSRG